MLIYIIKNIQYPLSDLKISSAYDYLKYSHQRHEKNELKDTRNEKLYYKQ